MSIATIMTFKRFHFLMNGMTLNSIKRPKIFMIYFAHYNLDLVIMSVKSLFHNFLPIIDFLRSQVFF